MRYKCDIYINKYLIYIKKLLIYIIFYEIHALLSYKAKDTYIAC